MAFVRNVCKLFIVCNGVEDDCSGRTTAETTDAMGEDCILCDGGVAVSSWIGDKRNGEDGRAALVFIALTGMVSRDSSNGAAAGADVGIGIADYS
jgi:hypothetical protein